MGYNNNTFGSKWKMYIFTVILQLICLLVSTVIPTETFIYIYIFDVGLRFINLSMLVLLWVEGDVRGGWEDKKLTYWRILYLKIK